MFQDRKTNGCGLTTFTIMVTVSSITNNDMLGYAKSSAVSGLPQSLL